MEEEPMANSKNKRKRTSSRQDDSHSTFGSVALASPTRPSTLRFRPSRISDNSWNGSDGYTAGGEEERTSSGMIEVRTSGPQASTSTGFSAVAGPSRLSQHRDEAPYATASASRSIPPRIKPSTFDAHSSSVPSLSFPFLPPLPTQAPISQDVIPSPRRTDRKSRFAPDLSFDYSIKSRLHSVPRRPSLSLPRNTPHVPPSTLPSPSRLPRIPDALPLPLPSSSKFLGPSRVSERIARSKVAGSRGATESSSSSNGGGGFGLVRSYKVKEYSKPSIPKKKRQLSRKFVSSSDDAQVPVEVEDVEEVRKNVDTALENNKEEEESIVRNEKRKTVIEEIWISSDEDEGDNEDGMLEMDMRGVGTQEAAIGLSLLASKEEVQERVGSSPRSSIPAKRPLYRSSLTARKSVPTPERVRRKLTSTGTNSVLDENDKDEIAFEFLEYSTTSSLTHSQRKRLSQATRKSGTVGGVQQRRALIADRKSAPYLGRYSPTSSEDNSSPPPYSASSSLPVARRYGAHKVSRKDLLSVAARKTVPAFRASSPQSPRARSSSLSDAHSSPPAPSVREEIAPGVNVVSPQPQLEETSHLRNSTRPPDDSIPAIPPLSEPPSTTLPFSRDPFPASTRIESTENQSPAPTSFKPTASASFYSRSTSRPPTPSLLLRTSIPTTTSIVVDSTAATTVNSQVERALTRPSPSRPLNDLPSATTPVDTSKRPVSQSIDCKEEGGDEPAEARVIGDETRVSAPNQRETNWKAAPGVRTLELEAQKFLPKTFERVGASERMLRKRSSNGSVVVEKPREESSTPSETSSVKKGKNDEKETKGKGQGKSWIELLRIDDGPRVQIPRDFKAPPQPWLVDDPEDSIKDCIHGKQVLFSLDKVVLRMNTIKSKIDSTKAILTLRLETQNTIHGFPPTLALASSTIPYFFSGEGSDTADKEPVATGNSTITLRPDLSHPLASHSVSLPFDPNLCRRAGAISITLHLALQFGTRRFETRHDLCSVSSPFDPLIPRPGAPFLAFDDSDPTVGMGITIDVVPVRKQIISANEAHLEIERRLARMNLDREGVWIPNAQAIRREGHELKEYKMVDLGRDGKYGYDFLTKLPYHKGEVVRDWIHDTPENTAHWVRIKDEDISRSTVSPQEKLLARAHMRWGMLNPYPPTILDREITCWVHYAPLVHHFSLRFELARLLLTRHLKHRLLTESEIRQILNAYDLEKGKIERGERRSYEELRREAKWVESKLEREY